MQIKHNRAIFKRTFHKPISITKNDISLSFTKQPPQKQLSNQNNISHINQESFIGYKQSFQLPKFGLPQNGLQQKLSFKAQAKVKSRLRTLQSQPNRYAKYSRNSLNSITLSNQKMLISQNQNYKISRQRNVKRVSTHLNSINAQNQVGQVKNRAKGYSLSIQPRYKGSYASNQVIRQSKPQIKIKRNLRSNTLVSQKDLNFDQLLRRQFNSLEPVQIKESPQKKKNTLHSTYLTQYEKQQIQSFKQVYYIGHKAHLRKYKSNFKDSNDNYKPIIGDHIAYRFQICRIIGSGAFGKVLEVLDHKLPQKKRKKYALKILKQSQQLYEQFQLQIKILKIVKQYPNALKNIIQIKGNFQFRGHICIVTELLQMNIYSYIKNQQFQGLPLDAVRKIIIQLLQALLFLHQRNIIHCDIKPENIIFKELGKSGIKLIDFGSACFSDNKQFTYIQSRYYRSPQIVLMKPYDKQIDIWSVGCLVYEIFTGSPLFPARSESQQMAMVQQTLGCPPKYFLDKCQRSNQFDFPSNYQPLFPIKKRIGITKQTKQMINFIQSTVKWNPQDRLTVKQALNHQFILQGLPNNVREQHLSQMRSQNPYGLI